MVQMVQQKKGEQRSNFRIQKNIHPRLHPGIFSPSTFSRTDWKRRLPYAALQETAQVQSFFFPDSFFHRPVCRSKSQQKQKGFLSSKSCHACWVCDNNNIVTIKKKVSNFKHAVLTKKGETKRHNCTQPPNLHSVDDFPTSPCRAVPCILVLTPIIVQTKLQ